ncbi:flagellar motor switch protein FliM [Blastopirellula marina]|uniref:Flagellar motor switch protein FliM n=1 Tax=Blastopirellula marina TaxID=124 RepID=A0A2S8F3Y0_9BACT|nr:flagellar motor switch protein FliM [Blastopirellula marina]PQO26861.1 flagellar motor switch protein FliM [Blastopirellula marina]PQO41549.1 flagellar motor switch protein FliM [Blastopirellula marina]PTL41068.1 flagellar motor switch protein FliM [Blastopirellula marina]
MGNDNVLSQAEVESLLSAMEASGPKKTEPAAAPQAAAVQSFSPAAGDDITRPSRPREKITPYDFKRPERVGKEQMRALQSMHEGFGRNFGAALSGLLRNIVEVKLTSVDQLTYSEFIFSLENPSCFNLLTASPLEGNLILDINPSILYPIIDRLLGGGKESSPVSRRPLTEIELTLVSRITNLFLRELRSAWENVLELQLGVVRVESNPQLVQIVPPNEVVVLISFELTIGDVRGMMNLCIPFNSIERIGGKLTANTWFAYGTSEVSEESRRALSSQMDGASVELGVTLAETTITTEDLLDLRVGDVITTSKDSREPLKVSVNGVTKFLAYPGAFKGRKAIQVDAIIPPKNQKPPQPKTPTNQPAPPQPAKPPGKK